MTAGPAAPREQARAPGRDGRGAGGEVAAEPVTPAQRVLTFVGSVLAPTGLVTGLLFYFGMLHANWFFAYFGVNYTVLGLSAQDFLIRSADGLFIPLAGLSALVLAGLWTFRSVAGRIPEPAASRVLAVAPPAAVVAGTALLVVAGVAALRPGLFAATLGLPGLCLAAGVLALASVPRLRAGGDEQQAHRRPPGVAAIGEWAACFVLVGVGLFWAAGDYSAAVGTGRGHAVELDLPASPDVVLHSAEDLRLVSAGVTATPCADGGDGPAAYRYQGLKLIMQAGDRYVLLPAGWRHGTGAAIVLPRTDSVRLEFSAPGSTAGGTC
jgi:hypothetical protein